MMHSDISLSPHITHWPPERGMTKNSVEEVPIPEPQDAFRKSKEIENWLQEENKVLERRRNGVKILLLGQSESGKSCVLKNFQLAFLPKTFDQERSAWKIIIYLNVIASLKTIIEVLEEVWEGTAPDNKQTEDAQSALQTFQTRRLGLSPLFLIESNLLKLLAPDRNDCRNMTIRAGDNWKASLFSNPRGTQVIGEEHDPTPILVAQRHDIITLWRNAEIQRILVKRRPTLRHSSGFFMDDIERVTSANFVPTDCEDIVKTLICFIQVLRVGNLRFSADILRARLRTIGIDEQHFKLDRRGEGPSTSSDFYIIDVAGARSQRHTWIPFFDDVQCILFLAPLAFNETLEEDHKINKIEDSFLLWKTICKNKLLANIHIILFLNKRDVLEDRIAAGVQVKDFVPTFKDRPNDVESVTKYFRDRFQHFHKRYSPPSRIFKCHETSAIDVNAMRALLSAVRDSILRGLLVASEML